jgi:hypothetical protein
MTARHSQPEPQRQGAPRLPAGTPEDMTSPPEALDRFWRLAEPLLARPGVTRSTMMGLPCLRLDGAFFASCDRRTGDLLVKLPETRVGELIEAGTAHLRPRRAAVPAVGRHPARALPRLEAPPRRSRPVRRHPAQPAPTMTSRPQPGSLIPGYLPRTAGFPCPITTGLSGTVKG